MSGFVREEGVCPEGNFTAWVDDDALKAEVRDGDRVVRRFRGESAWSDAVRYAGDRNFEREVARR